MTDIRKRVGRKGTTYQVRFPSAGSKTGFAYKTFDTMKEARHFIQTDLPALKNARHHLFRSVPQAIEKWLDVCEHEGREGKDPVSKATLRVYQSRADAMKAYDWSKELHELGSADVVAFRSWLLRNYSRDQAKKILSSFHSVLLEMVTQGVLSTDPAAQITIQQSRYREAVRIPSVPEVRKILSTADALAEDSNYWVAKAWRRYRAMIYLAADSGLRPQEYLALAQSDLLDAGVRVRQALDRSNRIGPAKSRAGHRFIPLGAATVELVREFMSQREGTNPHGLCFPGEDGGHQRYNNFLRRGWHVLMERAGLVERDLDDDAAEARMLYTPYSLRHFYASMLIARNVDLKTIQERMGHQDASLTLNVYGHLVRLRQAEAAGDGGILHGIVAA